MLRDWSSEPALDAGESSRKRFYKLSVNDPPVKLGRAAALGSARSPVHRFRFHTTRLWPAELQKKRGVGNFSKNP